MTSCVYMYTYTQWRIRIGECTRAAMASVRVRVSLLWQVICFAPSSMFHAAHLSAHKTRKTLARYLATASIGHDLNSSTHHHPLFAPPYECHALH